MKSLDHPMTLAAEIARLLESDPIAAAQVKEHITPERLRELLGLSKFPIDTEEDEDEALRAISDMAILQYVGSHFSKSRVLSYLK